MDQITKADLYRKLVWHNAWTDYPLTLSNRGAGQGLMSIVPIGDRNSDTFALSDLSTNKKYLWDMIDYLGKLERQRGLQRKTPLPYWKTEAERLHQNKPKLNHGIYDRDFDAGLTQKEAE